MRRGSEEYLDSEKYEIRHWDLERPDSLRPLMTRVNEIRNTNPALENDWSLKFHTIDNDQLIGYIEGVGGPHEPAVDGGESRSAIHADRVCDSAAG